MIADRASLRAEVHREVGALRGELHDEVAWIRAEFAEVHREIAELRVDIGRMFAANTEALRSDWRVMMEQSDARFWAQQAAREAHIRDPRAHAQA